MNFLEKFHEIKVFVFDVDGVLTNGNMLLLEDGRMLRQFNSKDGYALRKAKAEGYKIAVLTRSSSKGLEERLKEMGVEDVYLKVENKEEAFREFIYTYDIDPGTLLYMGDDWPDYEVMRLAGISACPQDAIPEIIEIAQYISPYKGGAACVRDVIEKVLKIQEKWKP